MIRQAEAAALAAKFAVVFRRSRLVNIIARRTKGMSVSRTTPFACADWICRRMSVVRKTVSLSVTSECIR